MRRPGKRLVSATHPPGGGPFSFLAANFYPIEGAYGLAAHPGVTISSLFCANATSGTELIFRSKVMVVYHFDLKIAAPN
jgi:hypothetical protein